MKHSNVHPTLSVALFFALSPLLLAPIVSASWNDGVSAFQAGRYQEAASAFQAITQQQPDFHQGHYMLGMSLAKQGQNKAALAPLRRALSLAGEDPQIQLFLAHAELKSDQGKAALETLSRLNLKTVPAKLQANYGQILAKAAVEANTDQQAYETLAKATTAMPDSKALWTARGTVSKRLDRQEDAYRSFSKARTLDPTDIGSTMQAIDSAMQLAQVPGTSASERADWHAKAGQLARGVPTEKLDSSARQRVAQALLMAGETSTARELFTQLAGQDAKNPAHAYQLASCDLAQMKSESALQHLNKALALSPDAALTVQIHTARGKALRQLERFDDAAKAFATAGKNNLVAEMDRLAEIKRNNAEWAKDRQKCLERQAKANELRKDSEILKGTPAWEKLEREINSLTTGCDSYLKLASS